MITRKSIRDHQRLYQVMIVSGVLVLIFVAIPLWYLTFEFDGHMGRLAIFPTLYACGCLLFGPMGLRIENEHAKRLGDR